jgi:hypothetical protein
MILSGEGHIGNVKYILALILIFAFALALAWA